MKTLKNKLLVALVIAFAVTLGAAVIPTVGMQVKAADLDNFQITLTDGIAVKYYATLGAEVTAATATFTSETEALNATVKGEKSDDKWVFTYNEVTPQYVDATFSVKIGEETKVENYSVLEYLNTIINGKYAAEYKTVAKDLVYYGEAAKAFKLGGTVAAQPGTAYAGGSKMRLTEKFDENTRIYSATVVFDTLPAIRFGFKKASEAATVTVDGKDITNALVKGENDVYTYTVAGIYAVDFDTQYTVVLTDGDKKQTLKYSINDYAARMQNSENAAMKTLAKALYCYGAGAKALKTEAYVVVTEPTYTETGVAKNGKGDEIALPILNDANYNFTQKTKDGNDYKVIKDSQGKDTYNDYAKGTLGTAYFTHKEHSEIVIEKEITADTITFNWENYNNVDINFRAMPAGMSAKYVDGVYVFTLTNDIEIPNFSKLSSVSPSVKMIGNGDSLTLQYGTQLKDLTLDGVSYTSTDLTVQSLTIIGESSVNAKLSATELVVDNGTLTYNGNIKLTNITVKNKGSLNVSGSVTVTKLLLVESGATFNVTADGDTISVADDGVLELYGTVNITSKTKGKATAICLWNNSSIKVSSDSRITVTDYEYAFGKWVDNEKNEDGTPKGRNGNLYIPSTFAISEKYVKKDEVNLVDASTCTYFYSYWSISVKSV